MVVAAGAVACAGAGGVAAVFAGGVLVLWAEGGVGRGEHAGVFGVAGAVVGVVVGGVLGDHGVVPAGHGDLVVAGRLGGLAGVLVEELEEGLVRVLVEVVDLVAPGEQVGDGGWGRLVHDGRGHDVGDVAVVVLGGDLELRVGVEAPERGQVDVAAEDGDADRELGADALEALDQVVAFLLVRAGRVVVVEVVEEVDAAVEAVEEAAAETDAAVQELDGA